MNDNKDAVNWPEHLGVYISIAWDLYVEKEYGSNWDSDARSAGERACLDGITQGFNRAQNRRFEMQKQQAAAQQAQRGTMR